MNTPVSPPAPLPVLPPTWPRVPPGRRVRTPSPLELMDHLISLAREADRAGHGRTASELVGLALAVC